MIELKFNNTTASIDKGELVSLLVENHEFIHQKGSPGWGSSDTEMFPIIGPVKEAGFQVQVPKGNAIQDQHGHLRQFDYELVSSSAYEATYSKTYKAGTPVKNSKYPKNSDKQWLMWPYSFQFTKHFKLDEQSLEISFIVDGERDMPFMVGYHPAFKLHSDNPIIKTSTKEITIDEVLAVGSRALEVPNCEEITLIDKKKMIIKTEGFGHFMCWTEVRNMVCIEPISFYPYAVPQKKLHEGFNFLADKPQKFKVKIVV